MTRIAPRVVKTRHVPTDGMNGWIQAQADAAYRRLRLGSDGLGTEADCICASDRPVAPHRDTEGVEPGMLVHGLVLRSDGHRLHSDRLHETGRPEGILLSPGDFYVIEPDDRHWTTVPDGSISPELIFTVCVMHPDGRSAKTLAKDMWWTVLAASIDALRAAR